MAGKIMTATETLASIDRLIASIEEKIATGDAQVREMLAGCLKDQPEIVRNAVLGAMATSRATDVERIEELKKLRYAKKCELGV